MARQNLDKLQYKILGQGFLDKEFNKGMEWYDDHLDTFTFQGEMEVK